jgi:hypothetical protein
MRAMPTCGYCNVDAFSVVNIQNKTMYGVGMGVIFLT